MLDTPPAHLNGHSETMADLLRLDERAFRPRRHGEIVDGTVVYVDAEHILVDIGGKSEGVISAKERGRGESDCGLVVGDQVTVFVLQPENETGNVVLSLRRARDEATWIEAVAKYQTGDLVEAEGMEVSLPSSLSAKSKGGVVVQALGLRGFMPASQVGRDYSGHPRDLIGKRVMVKIIEVSRERKRLIVSRKAAEDADRTDKRREFFDRFKLGDTVKGTVSGITTYGAFVDIGGIDGLVHVSELSWDRVARVEDVVRVGQEIVVSVVKLDDATGRISLSLRQARSDPWQEVASLSPVGSLVYGTVAKLKPFGAFLELAPSVEGLIHISEMSWRHVTKPSDLLAVGQRVQVKVIGIDSETRRISLSLKQA